MIKGQVFANQLFENQIFALFINTFTDGKDGVSDNYKNGMAITYSGSDVTIDSGAVLIQGRFLEEDTSTTISAGADNMYCKLVIEIDLDKTNTTTEFNQGYYKIVKSSTTWPTLTQTNIVKNVSGIYQYELARFRTTANGITDFEDRRTFIDFTSIYDEIREHIQAIDDESIFVLKSGSIMTGKLIAGGGIEGNVEGNLTGNSATASKLLTARTIALSGAVTGSASFDGHANVTISTTQSNIAVLSGTVTVTGTTQEGGSYHYGTGTKTLSYPSGFNADNCVVLSIETAVNNSTELKGAVGEIGYTYSSAANSMPNGGAVNAQRGKYRNTTWKASDGLHLIIYNSEVGTESISIKYKVVLMKIA